MFLVDVSGLEAFARSLGEACGAMSALKSSSNAETGEASLDGACGNFQDKWSYGLLQLGQTTQALQEGLQATAKAYRSTEQGIVESLGGSGSGGSGLVEHKRGGPVDGTPVKVPVGRVGHSVGSPRVVSMPVTQDPTGVVEEPVTPVVETPAPRVKEDPASADASTQADPRLAWRV